jgi:hypothetical protein
VAGVQQNNRLASASYPDPSPMPGGPISVSYSYDDSGHCVRRINKFLDGEEGQKRAHRPKAWVEDEQAKGIG